MLLREVPGIRSGAAAAFGAIGRPDGWLLQSFSGLWQVVCTQLSGRAFLGCLGQGEVASAVNRPHRVAGKRKSGFGPMNRDQLRKSAARVCELIDAAPSSSRDAAFFRANEFLQQALLHASQGEVDCARSDDGLTRWMMEYSNREDMILLDAVATFLILLRGWELPS